VRRRFAGGMGRGVEADCESATEMVSSRDRESNLGSSVNVSESISDKGDPGDSSGAIVVNIGTRRQSSCLVNAKYERLGVRKPPARDPK
jgi:hypothetical protein